MKGLGMISIWTLMGALGMSMVLVVDPVSASRVARAPKRQIHTDVKRHWRNKKALIMMREEAKITGAIGGRAFWGSLSPRQRSEIMRHRAKLAWRTKRRRAHERAMAATTSTERGKPASVPEEKA
jgi:hypothetical protein